MCLAVTYEDPQLAVRVVVCPILSALKLSRLLTPFNILEQTKLTSTDYFQKSANACCCKKKRAKLNSAGPITKPWGPPRVRVWIF